MKVTRIPPPIQPAYIRIEMTEETALGLQKALNNVTWTYQNGSFLRDLQSALSAGGIR